MSTATTSIEQLAINTIRTLSMDGVQQANSGHPGTPMALAPVAYQLWNHHLNYDPAVPHWPARDRFVLSCGHASMLLYSVLHLADVRNGQDQPRPTKHAQITLDDLRNFRQWGSPCAGHPEYGDAPGIETTTGPLGQGVGNSVGMAAAARWLGSRYDRPGFELFDYNVYALCSDGDLMEGIASEAASMAGHLKLSNLCWIYDDNHITIEGHTDLAFGEEVGRRFEGLGWQVLYVDDANHLEAIDEALARFESHNDAPTLIVLRSIIGWGAPNKADSAAAHGSPLGEEEIRGAKETYGWPVDEKFLVPEEVRKHFAEGIGDRGEAARQEWDAKFAEYTALHEQEAAELNQIFRGELPAGWDADIPSFEADAKGLASRASSGQVLNSVAPNLPWLVGGSADLAPSNNTMLKMDDARHFGPTDHGGRNFHFGVREHAMAACCTGMALTGLKPYCGTFFTFTDYMRPAMRLASLMRIHVLYVLTHDSIGLGEDGPTHQPVEHLAACRSIPGLSVIRPADANEVSVVYQRLLALNDRPAALVLTRQNLSTLDRSQVGSAELAARGGYTLVEAEGGAPQVILIGTGSEVGICLAAHQQLVEAGVKCRVVSMPCWEWFDEQDADYRESVLPASVIARVAVEAGIVQGWEKYLGTTGRFIGMQGFGASAPQEELYQRFGITAEKVVEAAQSQL